MFFDDIIGQSMIDFERGGFAGALTSIGLSSLARQVAQVQCEFVGIASRSAERGTAGRIRDAFLNE